ncbi:hypothetical protein [Embleya sp. AB8]|uniref:hypothetical protein n=1 Tax=Embleya sp. AB8 TaxID=3156304 RepID=UPI003C748FFB
MSPAPDNNVPPSPVGNEQRLRSAIDEATIRRTPETDRRALALSRLRATAEDAFDLDLLEDKRNYRR